MTTTDKLTRIASLCECEVSIGINEHRNYYQTAEQRLAEYDALECPPDIDAATRAKMIETNTIVSVYVYPHTPIGSWHIVHYDLGAALDMALLALGQ